MFKKFNAVKSAISRGYLTAGVAVGTALAATGAHAVSPFDATMDAVDLSGVALKVGAAALLIVGIALAFKSPDVAKRVIRKV